MTGPIPRPKLPYFYTYSKLIAWKTYFLHQHICFSHIWTEEEDRWFNYEVSDTGEEPEGSAPHPLYF